MSDLKDPYIFNWRVSICKKWSPFQPDNVHYAIKQKVFYILMLRCMLLEALFKYIISNIFELKIEIILIYDKNI